ncbi:MAG: phosphate transport regulator-like protein [Parcubacteria group bacterium Gr01-1014_8]|nr:MAG: phosphate transport regulator-like protein [Parcubacteria group bacterium Gr01-1014_8]
MFGKSQNTPLAEMLFRLSDAAALSAKRLRETKCSDLERITEFEHTGDETEAQIHEILDNSFILRFDKSDVTHLAAELDDMLDGMRRVAKHVHMYGKVLSPLKPQALEFLDIIASMTTAVRDLVKMLSEKRLSQSRIKECVKRLAHSESIADRTLENAAIALIAEFNIPGKSAIEFSAWDKLFRLLEGITDSADHCGRLVLSMARKET